MIKKFLLSFTLVTLMVAAAEAITFSVGPDRYHGFSHSDFYYRTYVRPQYMAPQYYGPRHYRPQYLPPYANPYYSLTIPYYSVPVAPRGLHFQLRVR